MFVIILSSILLIVIKSTIEFFMYKLFYFYHCPITGNDRYCPIPGLWRSVSDFLLFIACKFGFDIVNSTWACCNFIKIPFFGYHSRAHTGFSQSDLRVPRSLARRPEK